MFNKIAGAVLGTLLVLVALRIVAEEIWGPEEAEDPGTEVVELSPTEMMLARIAEANPDDGAAAAGACQGCHTINEGGGTIVGPSLFNIVERTVGAVEGFNYSDGMAALRGEGATWTYELLDEFLANPGAAIPGTRMGFAGISDDDTRAAVIAYLRTLSNDPVPLPAVAAAGHEPAEPATPATLEEMVAAADPTAGQSEAGHCVGCHTLDEGGANMVGPNLFGIVGKRIGASEGYNYSEALASLGAEGATWTLERLDAWVANPNAAIPGNRMPYAGLDDDAGRHNLLAYLLTLTTAGAAPAAPAEPAPAAPAEPAPAAPAEPAPAAPAPAGGGVITGDPVAGEAAAAACMGCHTINEGGGTVVGPNLFGVVDRAVGGVAGFNYSDALAALNAQGATWTPERLNEFLINPAAAVPGNRMPFPGIADDTNRANVIAFLATLTPAEGAAPAAPAEPAPAAPAPAAEPAPAPAAAPAPAPAAEPAPAAAAPAEPAPVAMLTGDATAGEAMSAQCRGCHTLNEGGPAVVGPNLFGVVGRVVGSVEGFAYSDALKALNTEGATWTPERLDAFLAGPAAAIPGNRMPFAGISSEQDRADLIAYLSTLVVAEAPAAAAPAEVALAPVTFTVVQGNWGQLQYGFECAACHGDALEGGRGPALTGETFMAAWEGKPVSDFATAIRSGGPHPGDTVSAEDYAAIIAFVLRENGFTASSTALPTDAADLVGIGIVQ